MTPIVSQRDLLTLPEGNYDVAQPASGGARALEVDTEFGRLRYGARVTTPGTFHGVDHVVPRPDGLVIVYQWEVMKDANA